jgi:hypothetical protein
LAAGQHFTVLQWVQPNEPEAPNLFEGLLGGGFIGIGSRSRSATLYCGTALKIKAVELPYIVFEIVGEAEVGRVKPDGKRKPLIMDVRQVVLMELSDEYVKAMEGAT